MNTYIVIPARLGSTRLAEKLLLPINNRPVLYHVYQKALQTSADKVIIAGDDQKIIDCAKEFAANVCATSENHQSGTERIAEVVDLYNIKDEDIVINLQGDEPLMEPKIIEQLIVTCRKIIKMYKMITICQTINSLEELFNCNITKVVCNKLNEALYFTRAVVPWYRVGFEKDEKFLPNNYLYHRHLGIYGYEAKFIKTYVKYAPSPLEKLESLEQLRALYYGDKIYVDITEDRVRGPSVDTIEDLEIVREICRG